MPQQLIAASTELELEKFVPIPIEFKIGDVRDIQKKVTPHSRTISLPGTKINNEFFGGLYDFNADFTIFNPNIKTPARLISDGQDFLNGYMQLKEVTRNDKGQVNYNVVIYDTVADFWNELNKKKIIDLDYTTLNHIYRKSDIENSWTNVWTDGFYYPMLYNTASTIKTTDFRPAIFQKYLLDKIIDEAGFTWSGNLKTSVEFEKEIILNEMPLPAVSSAVADSKTFRASKSLDESLFINNNAQMLINTGDIPFSYDDETTAPNFDTNNLWNQVNKFTAGVNGLYSFSFSDITVKVTTDYISNPSSNPNPDNAHIRHRLRAVIKDGGGVTKEVINASQTFFQLFTPIAPFGVPQTITNNDVIPGGVLLSPNTGQYIYMEAGWTVEWYIDVLTWALTFPKTTITQTESEVLNGCVTQSNFIIYAYTDNTPLVFSDFINTKFEQKDIIKDIIARYNCFIYINPDNDKDIVFDIRDEFYKNGPILDWTNKKDFNTRDKIKLIAELQKEEMLLTYTKGEDDTNKQYTDTIGDKNIYGQFEFNFTSDFVKGKKKIESPFVPTPLVFHPGMKGIVPSIHSQQPIKGMRLLYVGGVIQPGLISWDWEYVDLTGTTVTDTINGYPYAGHYDEPYNPTIDINFGILPFPSLYYSPNQTTENNLYTRYWRNQINQIINGRMVITKFNLNPNDIYFVKQNPNTRLFVDNKYYYINKIKYEANEDLRNLTSVELITVEDELIFDAIVPAAIEQSGDIKGGFTPPPPPDKGFPIGRFSNTDNGNGNIIGDGSSRIVINGDNNFIDANRTGNFINGNNNRVYGSDVIIIGNDGLTIRGDGITVINDVVTRGCLSSILFNKIDGGLDNLTPTPRNCTINKIISQKDGKFNNFNVNLWNKIDSVNGITEEITDFFN